MELGQKLKSARIRCGLTQEAVVRQLGVSRQTVSNWENNRSYPDLASALKLSSLYGLSLDDLLESDHALRRKLEEQAERRKRACSWLHDLAMLLIAAGILLVWMEKPGVGILLGAAGYLLLCIVQAVFVRKLGADRKTAFLRCTAVALWLTGFLLRRSSGMEAGAGELLWMAGLALQCYAGYRGREENLYPRHMTAFTGFVLALVLVFGAVPFVSDSLARGDHIEENPFTGVDYRVCRVRQGESEELPMVYLGTTNRAYLDYPGEKQQMLSGRFAYITQPEGAARKGVWELIPEEAPQRLYRVAVEADGSVTMACMDDGGVLWDYVLEIAPRAGCTVRDVMGVTYGSAGWQYAGSLDEEAMNEGLLLRGKGTVSLSVPGEGDAVTVYEELRCEDRTEHRVLTLTREEDSRVEFYRETEKKQTGIYRIPYEDGEFVLVLKYIP